jgi:hypothetical protein
MSSIFTGLELLSILSSGSTVESDVAYVHKKSRESMAHRKASLNPGQVTRSKEKPTTNRAKKREAVREQDNEVVQTSEPESDRAQSRA